MTENEVIKVIETEKQCVLRNNENGCDRDCICCDLVMAENDIICGYDTAIKALEEIQQYRAIGTVKEIEPYVRLGEKLNLCDLVRENARLVKKIQHLEVYEKQLKEYEKIATVEECREAMEKQKPQPPDIWGDSCDKEGNIIYDMYDCPGCGQSYEIDDKYKHCPECGQAIDWRGLENL